jgi:hypothetical protein
MLRDIVPFEGYTCEQVLELLVTYKARILNDLDTFQSHVCMMDTLDRIATAFPVKKEERNLVHRIEPLYEVVVE